MRVQIKCYSPGTIGGNLFNEEKESIKEKIKNIVSVTRYFFGCLVNEWYYLIVLYLNPNDNKEIDSFLITKCHEELFEYIFYNPFTHEFRDKDNSIIYEYKIGKKSNLDNNSSNFGNPNKDFNNLVNYYLNKKRDGTENIYEKYFNDYVDFIKEFDRTIDYNTPNELLKKTMDNIIIKIKTIINILPMNLYEFNF